MAILGPTDDMEMEKIAEDELSKLQRQVSFISCLLVDKTEDIALVSEILDLIKQLTKRNDCIPKQTTKIYNSKKY